MLKCPQMTAIGVDWPDGASGICENLRESADVPSWTSTFNAANETTGISGTWVEAVYEQYVYDQRYIDAPVMVYRDTNTDGTVDQRLYIAQDANFNVTAVVDGATGVVVNRFVYTPYGQRTVLTATWTAGTTDFMLGHQGLMLDAESGLYYNRARYLHPTLGSFIQRDPLGYVDGANVYQYERSNPTAFNDPLGLYAPSDPFCVKLRKKIYGKMAELLKRYAQIAEDVLGLREKRPNHVPGMRRRDSVEGHRIIIKEIWTALNRDISLYKASCGDDDDLPPPVVRVPVHVTRPFPIPVVPRLNCHDTKDWTAGGPPRPLEGADKIMFVGLGIIVIGGVAFILLPEEIVLGGIGAGAGAVQFAP